MAIGATLLGVLVRLPQSIVLQQETEVQRPFRPLIIRLMVLEETAQAAR